MVKEMEVELCSIKMGGDMKENGKMMWEMEEVMRDTLMEIFTKVNFKKEKHMAMVFINGLMERNLMDNGKREWDMGKVYGKELHKIIFI